MSRLSRDPRLSIGHQGEEAPDQSGSAGQVDKGTNGYDGPGDGYGYDGPSDGYDGPGDSYDRTRDRYDGPMI